MANVIRNLRLNRIDLVDAPANPRAHVVLVKRDVIEKRIRERNGKYEVTTEDGSRVLGTHPTREEAQRQLAAIEANKHKKSAAPSVGSVHVNVPSRRTVVKTERILKGLASLFKGAQAEPEVTQEQIDALAKTIDGFGDVSKLAADHPVHTLITMKKGMEDQVACAANPDDDGDDDDEKKEQMKVVEKRAAEIAKAENIALQKRVEAAEAKAAAAETLAKAHQEASDTAAVTSELKKFDHLTLDMEKQVPLFKSLKATQPELYKSTLESLAAANEVAKAGKALEISVGTTRGGGSGPTAWQEIEKLAGEMVSKSGSSITKAKAIDMIMQQRVDLVKRYYEEENQVIA